MTTSQIKTLIDLLKSKGIVFAAGLAQEETLEVEQKFDLTFPPDVKEFLQAALPVSKGFYDWRKALYFDEEASKIQSMINWPLEGIQFDID